MDNAIGIDIGYGSTKTYNGSGGRIFPTAITSMVPEETFGEVRPIEVNGEKFLVGEDVLSKWVIDTRRIGFLGSNAWLASLAQAIVTNGLDPEDMDGKKIVLGVPPGHYSKNTARKLTNVINSSIFNYNGKHYELAGAGEALAAAANMANRYLADAVLPAAALQLLHRSCALLRMGARPLQEGLAGLAPIRNRAQERWRSCRAAAGSTASAR